MDEQRRLQTPEGDLNMWSLYLVRPQSAGSLYEQQHQEDGDDTQPLSKINSHVRMMPPHDVDNKQRSKQTDRQIHSVFIDLTHVKRRFTHVYMFCSLSSTQKEI